ncbi:MAG TPA: Uma2 family endonuclease [Byssovorax sp.]|jgi:Uma2 family endonuclease
MVAAEPLLAGVAEFLAQPEERRVEVVGGQLVEKAAPGMEHGSIQLALGASLLPRFQRGSGDPSGGLPGGWWIAAEVDVCFDEHEVYRPDVAGWRRERMPELSKERPVRLRPDWVCEILSPSNASTDLVDKFRVYERVGVPHYWIVDPERGVLTVYRLERERYAVALNAKVGETVRAEPFDAIELSLSVLFGLEDPA